MALLEPHPALKAASPQASPADMFLGDDFHHNGAFRLSYGFEYAAHDGDATRSNISFKFDRHDTFEWYLSSARSRTSTRSTSRASCRPGTTSSPTRTTTSSGRSRRSIPRLTKVDGPDAQRRRLVGPGRLLRPAQDLRDLRSTTREPERRRRAVEPRRLVQPAPATGSGGFASTRNTGKYFREKIQAPVLRALSQGQGRRRLRRRRVMFRTGANTWETYDRWPPREARPAAALLPRRTATRRSSRRRRNDSRRFDEYVSDPANPVPYRPRPITPTYPGPEWPTWLVQDQRFVHLRARRAQLRDRAADRRPDRRRVDDGEALRLDHRDRLRLDRQADRRLPGGLQGPPDLGGYQLMIADDGCAAGSARASRSPSRSRPGEVEEYTIDLHWIDHRFKKGHKIMVQIQSTWFPLIDRNPQKFVPNIFEAKDADFQKATQKVHRSEKFPSHVILDVLPVPK